MSKNGWVDQLVTELESLKLPQHLRNYLPERTEWDRDRIVNSLIKLTESIKADRIQEFSYDEYIKSLSEITKSLANLNTDLCDAHRATLN
jgi:hypothetical protein